MSDEDPDEDPFSPRDYEELDKLLNIHIKVRLLRLLDGGKHIIEETVKEKQTNRATKWVSTLSPLIKASLRWILTAVVATIIYFIDGVTHALHGFQAFMQFVAWAVSYWRSFYFLISWML